MIVPVSWPAVVPVSTPVLKAEGVKLRASLIRVTVPNDGPLTLVTSTVKSLPASERDVPLAARPVLAATALPETRSARAAATLRLQEESEFGDSMAITLDPLRSVNFSIVVMTHDYPLKET